MFQRQRVPEISAADAYARLTADGDQAVIIDVREPDEWVAGHIAAARHIPLGELGERLSEIPAEREVILICHSGQRSAYATALLLQNGFAQAINLQGGMVAWDRAGLPIMPGK